MVVDALEVAVGLILDLLGELLVDRREDARHVAVRGGGGSGRGGRGVRGLRLAGAGAAAGPVDGVAGLGLERGVWLLSYLCLLVGTPGMWSVLLRV